MPLSEAEIDGCTDLLQLLTNEELFSLAETVTKKQIDITRRNKSVAVKAIIAFSTSAEELLNRQKINKDVLFKYLVNKNTTPSVKSKKTDLITEVCLLWMKKPQAQVKVCSPPAPSRAKSSSKTELSSRNLTSPQTSLHLTQNNLQTEHKATVNYAPTTNYVVNQYNTVFVGASASPAPSNHDLLTLGQKFTQWFFDSLNSHNPIKGVLPKDFGPQHFYNEAELLLLMLGPQESREKCSGQKAVSERFLDFVRKEGLLFNPNEHPGGIMVDVSPHGLVVVLICGTVHRQNQCVGMFEQMFGLIKDPQFNTNYKIKVSKMKLRATHVTDMPKLTDRTHEEIQDLAAIP